MFYIAEFNCDKSVAIIPKAWMTSVETCHWPPVGNNPSKLVKNNCPVNPLWMEYQVRILGSCDSYEEASVKVQKATVDSDINTDQETNTQLASTSRAGRKLKPRKIITSESEDSETENYVPPQKKTPTLILPKPPSFASSQAKEQPLNDFANISKPQQKAKELETSKGKEVRIFSHFMSFEKKIILMLEQLKECQGNMMKALTRLEVAVQSSSSSVSLSTPNLPVEFPITTREELQALEEFLKDSSNMKLVVQYLAMLGGSSKESAARRILAHTMDKKLAVDYSYSGKKGKQAFKELYLKQATFAALQQSSWKDVTEHDLARVVGNWLRYLPGVLREKSLK